MTEFRRVLFRSAKTDQFRALANDIALQIANLGAKYVRREDIPAAIVEAEREQQRRRALEEGKPESVVDKIVDGRMSKFYEDLVLLEQPFIKDDSVTINELITRAIAELGENITVRRFARFEVGEDAGAE